MNKASPAKGRPVELDVALEGHLVEPGVIVERCLIEQSKMLEGRSVESGSSDRRPPEVEVDERSASEIQADAGPEGLQLGRLATLGDRTRDTRGELVMGGQDTLGGPADLKLLLSRVLP